MKREEREVRAARWKKKKKRGRRKPTGARLARSHLLRTENTPLVTTKATEASKATPHALSRVRRLEFGATRVNALRGTGPSSSLGATSGWHEGSGFMANDDDDDGEKKK